MNVSSLLQELAQQYQVMAAKKGLSLRTRLHHQQIKKRPRSFEAHGRKFGISRFYKSQVFTGTNDGFGLGLSVVRQLSEKLGYFVHIKSAVGRGTRITIEIPLNLQVT